ncbi:MAG: DUF2358 domain-containing protein [Snowella sp.]|nr:DUF2358 domain-containing protein [Snowella sp.]
MNILDILQADYQRFPANPSYEIYAEDVYFKDPLTEFRGIQRYQAMIQFMATWFQDIQMELHHLEQHQQAIASRWTLHWTTPLPWKPRISISGRSELRLNDQGLIDFHQDYWDCSIWQVLQQHLFPKTRINRHNQ